MRQEEEKDLAKTIRNWVLLVLGIIVVLLVLSTVTSFVYTVNQNEVAGVTRGGSLISATPVGPGYHFKIPWVDDVHKIRTSIDKIAIDKVSVKTTDNQFATVDLNLTYRVSDPFKALFKVGIMGEAGIIDKVEPFVKSRTLDVFGQVNALQIVDEKQKLEAELLTAVQAPAMDYFGERIEDVQITHIEYSQSFEANIEKMVQTRNEQISAQNILIVRQTEAKQQVAVAQGQADAAAAQADGAKRVAIAQAEGAAKTTTLDAEARATAQRLTADATAYATEAQAKANADSIHAVGSATGDSYKAQVVALGSSEALAEVLRAQSTGKWNGSVPQYQIGAGDKGAQSLIVLPQNLTK